MSGVFQTIDPPPPLPPSECVIPRTKDGAIHTRRAVRGWGVNISEDARHCSVLYICKYFVTRTYKVLHGEKVMHGKLM
jgi:hypothetical protein